MINLGIIASGAYKGPPTWYITQSSASFQDEDGGVIEGHIKCSSAKVGASMLVRFTGARIISEGYSNNWQDAIVDAARAVGCDAEAYWHEAYGPVAEITIAEGYVSGSDIAFNLYSIADNWTQEHVTFSPTYSQSNFQVNIVDKGVPSVTKTSFISFWLKDTSQDPEGLKQVELQRNYGYFVNEGMPIRCTLATQNLVAGTTIDLYVGAENYYYPNWETTFIEALATAVAEKGCDFAPYVGGLSGGTITITEAYDGTPFEIVWMARQDFTEEGVNHLGLPNDDAHIQLTEVIDPAEDYVRIRTNSASFWINDTSTEEVATRWRIYASPSRPINGEVVTYTLISDTGVTASSVDIAESGEGLTTFLETMDSAIATAIASATGISYSAGTFTVTADWSGEFSWTRTVNDSVDSYAGVRLSNAVDSGIVIQTAVILPNYTRVVTNDYLCGVNLSSGEFSPGYIPGVYNTNYGYPARHYSTPGDPYRDMDYWESQGINVIRLPFRWGRVQREEYADLYDGGFTGEFPTNESLDMARIDDIVDRWTGRGRWLILDLHHFGADDNGQYLGVDDDQTSPLAFYDLWEKLALRYKDNQLVVFGIMNEPTGQSVQDWGYVATGCVSAIRAVGAKNRVLVSSIGYTGAHSWAENGSASFYYDYEDPVGETIFDVHQYLDSNSSGTSASCTWGKYEGLVGVTDWALNRGFKLFLGEFNGGANTTCASEINNLMTVITNNQSAWLGWTAWGAGPWWPTDYIFYLNPPDYDDPDSVSPCWAQIKPHVNGTASPLRFAPKFNGTSTYMTPTASMQLSGTSWAIKMNFKWHDEGDDTQVICSRSYSNYLLLRRSDNTILLRGDGQASPQTLANCLPVGGGDVELVIEKNGTSVTIDVNDGEFTQSTTVDESFSFLFTQLSSGDHNLNATVLSAVFEGISNTTDFPDGVATYGLSETFEEYPTMTSEEGSTMTAYNFTEDDVISFLN